MTANEQEYIDPLEDHAQTVRLAEEWAQWSKTNYKEGRIAQSFIYRLYRARNREAEEECTRSYEFSLTEILAFNRAWGKLPRKYNLLMGLYYFNKLTVRKIAHLCGIRQQDFNREHRQAIIMIENQIG